MVQKNGIKLETAPVRHTATREIIRIFTPSVKKKNQVHLGFFFGITIICQYGDFSNKNQSYQNIPTYVRKKLPIPQFLYR